MGGATGDSEEIEVVVLRGEDDVEVGPPSRRRRPVRRRLLQVALTLLVVVGIQPGPVVVEQPVERAAAPRARPSGEGSCPDPVGLRLWCSFVDDPGCCPVAGADVVEGVQPAGSRAA